MNKLVLIAYVMMWFVVSVAVSIAIYVTQNIHCLWFLLIPTLVSIKTKDESEDSK